jgi:hypothetical protein
VERLDVTSQRVIQRLLAGQPNTEAKIIFAWRVAAGTTLGRAATLSWSADGTLLVRPKTAAWRTELLRARPVIQQRLSQLIGPDVIRRLSITEAE